MKKYTLIIAICCSLVTQYAKSAPLLKKEDELSTLHALINMTLTDSATIDDRESNITVILTKSDAPLLKTEDELSTLHAVTNMSLTDSDSDSVNTEDKEPYKIVGFIKRYNIDKQIYYGLLLGAIHSAQYRILYFCILRPLSLVHDPYDGKLTFVEAFTGAIIEEAIFNGLLLPLINYSIELATNSSTKFDGKIFILSDNNHHDEKIFIMSNLIKSTAFGLLHLAGKNPLMAQVLISMINSFVRGQFTKHYGLLSATVAHVTLNSMGYLVYIYSGREHF
ncbi:type II CAAX prenyl endopeptidase Rce1 family protein [Endozoicomonas sp. 8E]|uniref:CPBP family glutamic-type intramembrane protease n=1 Tax=Endozoicomonas sp. 8E TaxID=3035692 RepID=UPI0029391325|nr:CPBP family glutamic-type intramembrane protease [Endozoicomonas sp. 8E]WOG25960.1 CPBP family glutamic-type intramembrane protease [Endozoicomonas sp. 8E]